MERDVLATKFLSLQVPVLWVTVLSLMTSAHGASYSDVTRIFTDKLDSSAGYNTAVRPLFDQSKVVNVSVNFDIIAIVEVDDIKQNFIINGFLTLSWTDELLAWNPADYNNTYDIALYPNHVWRPRLILGNTLNARDLFEDDYCPTTAIYDGSIYWYPGSLFPTSCNLDLSKFPFDEQFCTIDLYSMTLMPNKISFYSLTREVGTTFFSESGEWKMVESSIDCRTADNIPFFQLKFRLQRRPGFFIMNIVMPVVLLSFLNIMVFLIPVESGEKISYSITVLLALAVFMSIVSEMLPRSSDILPVVTIYLMVLLIISVFSVLVTICIVSIHHRDEKETKRLKAAGTFKGLFNKVKVLNTATTPLRRVCPEDSLTVVGEDKEKALPITDHSHNNNNNNNSNNNTHRSKIVDVMTNFRNLKKTVPFTPDGDKDNLCEKNHVNRWRMISRHIDFVSLIVFMTIWMSVTIGFLAEISS